MKINVKGPKPDFSRPDPYQWNVGKPITFWGTIRVILIGWLVLGIVGYILHAISSAASIAPGIVVVAIFLVCLLALK